MDFSDLNVGFAITGSFCTFDRIKPYIKALTDKGARVTPVYSYNVQSLDTRFGRAEDFMNDIKYITGSCGIKTIQEAEPVGPKKLFDVLVIAPCTGNTMAKLVNGITDTPVLMAAKSHMRNLRPVVIAVSTNDALGINLQNIGKLMVLKNIYFVPFRQDDCEKKPNSMIAELSLIEAAIEAALHKKQLQPLLASDSITDI